MYHVDQILESYCPPIPWRNWFPSRFKSLLHLTMVRLIQGAQNENIRENVTSHRARGSDSRDDDDERDIENCYYKRIVYNNNAIPISQPVSIQRYLWTSERRCAFLPNIRYCSSGCSGDGRSCVYHRAPIRSLILEISRRAVYHRDYIASCVLCSDNGG